MELNLTQKGCFLDCLNWKQSHRTCRTLCLLAASDVTQYVKYMKTAAISYSVLFCAMVL